MKTNHLHLFALVLTVLLIVCFIMTATGCVLRLPADQAKETTPPATTDAPQPSTAPTGIRPEFKAAMDSYEAFFDEYCCFMNEYAQSGNPTAMLSEYMRFMTRYVEAMEQMEAMDDGSLSDAELAYYTEVTLRISRKLSSSINKMY